MKHSSANSKNEDTTSPADKKTKQPQKSSKSDKFREGFTMNENTRNTFASMVLEILKVKRIKTLACLAFITIYLTIPAYSQTNFLQLPINGKAVGIGYQRFYPRDYIFINMSNEGQIIKGSVHYALIDSLTFSVSGGLQFYDPLRTRYYDQHTAFFFQGTALY